MKTKIALVGTLFTVCFYVNAQNVFPTPSGNAGINNGSPSYKLDIGANFPGDGVRVVQTGNNSSALHLHHSSTSSQKHNWSLYSLGVNDGWANAPGSFAIHDQTGSPSSPRFFIKGDNGNIGIGTTSPDDRLHIGSGYTKVVLGTANSANLNYGTSYIGFNAGRQPSSGIWSIEADGSNNGGGTIFSDIFGVMHFATIESTGSSAKYLSDGDILSRSKLRLNPNGLMTINSKAANGTDDAFVMNDASNINNIVCNFKVKRNGTVYAREIYVQGGTFPDYVFANEYKLMKLDDLAQYISLNKHLPNVPSAKEVEEKGIGVGELNIVQMEKIEELTLYILELKKEIEQLKAAKK